MPDNNPAKLSGPERKQVALKEAHSAICVLAVGVNA